MCDVCVAEMALQKTREGSFHEVRWHRPSRELKKTQETLPAPGPTSDHDLGAPDRGLHIQAEGEASEFKPCRIRIRVEGGEWSSWVDGQDLASMVGRIGADVKWRSVPDEVRRIMLGQGGMAGVIQRMAGPLKTEEEATTGEFPPEAA